MMRSETDAASSYSGLISSESSHEKRGRLLRSIARKKNLIRLRSAALISLPFLSVILSMPTNLYLR